MSISLTVPLFLLEKDLEKRVDLIHSLEALTNGTFTTFVMLRSGAMAFAYNPSILGGLIRQIA